MASGIQTCKGQQLLRGVCLPTEDSFDQLTCSVILRAEEHNNWVTTSQHLKDDSRKPNNTFMEPPLSFMAGMARASSANASADVLVVTIKDALYSTREVRNPFGRTGVPY